MTGDVRLDRFVWGRAGELDPAVGGAVRNLVKKFQQARHPHRKEAYGEALEILASAFRAHADYSNLLGWERSVLEWERIKSERWPNPARVHLPGRRVHGRNFPGGIEMTDFLTERLRNDPLVPPHMRKSLERLITQDWLPSRALKELVAAYSGHPDYDERWRP